MAFKREPHWQIERFELMRGALQATMQLGKREFYLACYERD
jgi:hypothetical protein